MKMKAAKILGILISVLVLFASCGQLAGSGESRVSINLPYVNNANSRAVSSDALQRIKGEHASYRVHINNRVLEGTGGNFSAYFPVGTKVDVFIECVNAKGEVILRTVSKSIVVTSRENTINFNLKADGNEITPASRNGRVTYTYGEAENSPGNKSGLPTDGTSYKEYDVFEVKDGTGMTWDHGTFTGWKTDKELDGDDDSGTQDVSQGNLVTVGGKYEMPEGGVVLTAQWQKKTYTISYDMNASGSGGTQTSTNIGDDTGNVALGPAQVSADKPQAVNVVSSGKNYTFTHWVGSDGNTYQPGQSIQSITGNLTLTAQWSDKNVWTITYNKGNTQAQENAITNWSASANVVDGESVTLPTLSATGYTFGGWQIGSETKQGGTSYRPMQSINATAQWTLDTYTLSYNYDGGSENVAGDANFTVESQSVTFPTVNNKTGYTFSHWSVNNTDVTGFNGSQLLNLVTSGKSLALTAVWNINSYQVTYELDGGNGGPASGTVQYNASVSLDAPTKTGYIFAGWSDGNSTYGGTSGNNSLTMPAQAVTLTAQWSVKTYTIRYNSNGGSLTPSDDTVKITDVTISLSTDYGTKTGCTSFSHWKDGTDDTDVSGWTVAQFIERMENNGKTEITLTAKWNVEYKTSGNKSTWEVGDIVLQNTAGTIVAIHKDAYGDRDAATYGDGVAIVYKNEANKVYIIGKVHTGKVWCLENTSGYAPIFTDLQCREDAGGSAGKYTWTKGQKTDGSDNWQKLIEHLNANGLPDDTTIPGNYPAWEFCNDYGKNNNLSGDLATDWYLPTMAELFDIWKANSDNRAIQNALTAIGGSSLGSYYWSSSVPTTAEYADMFYFGAGQTNGTTRKTNNSVCAVHQLTY